eukprot:scaffold30434_cov129-Isochrysis_galbana.AAC.3
MERAARRPAAADDVARRAAEGEARASALGHKQGNEPLPPGLEEAARRAAASSAGSRQSLESALREQYGSTQP